MKKIIASLLLFSFSFGMAMEPKQPEEHESIKKTKDFLQNLGQAGCTYKITVITSNQKEKDSWATLSMMLYKMQDNKRIDKASGMWSMKTGSAQETKLKIEELINNRHKHLEALDQFLDDGKKLMKEALPDDRFSLPPDLKNWPLAKQFEFYVNQQMNPQNQNKGRLDRIFLLLKKSQQYPLFMDPLYDKPLEMTALKELAVYAGGEDKQHSLINNINKTKLHIGSTLLGLNLSQVKKPENLLRLQEQIQSLNKVVENNPRSTNLFKVIRKTVLEHIKPLEDNFLSFWIDETTYGHLSKFIKSKEFKRFYNYNDLANNSPSINQISQLGYFITSYMQEYEILRNLIPIGTILHHTYDSNIQSDLFASIKTLLMGDYTQLPEIKIQRDIQLKAMELLHKNLVDLVKFIRHLKILHQLLKDHDCLPELRDNLLIPTDTQEMKDLMELLEKIHTIKSAESLIPIPNWGETIVAWYKMHENRDKFIKAYYTLGMIDFLTSLSKLVNSQTENTPFCFAEFHNNPSIKAEKCWSPLVVPSRFNNQEQIALDSIPDEKLVFSKQELKKHLMRKNKELAKKRIVPNDISLGDTNPRTGILSGPNGNGKSTGMRAVGLASVLGLTLSIGSAKNLKIPENLNIITSMNIADDPQGLSLFQAGAHRIAHIVNVLNKNPEQKCLVIADEPLVGTKENIALAAVLPFIKHVAQKPNALALFSSHLEVTDLANQFPDLIANYRVTDFKLEPGIGQKTEAYFTTPYDILKQAGLPEVFLNEFKQNLNESRNKKEKSEKKPQNTPLENLPQATSEGKHKTSMSSQNIPVKYQGANLQCGYYALRNGLIASTSGNQTINTNDGRFNASNEQQVIGTQPWNQIFPHWQEEIIKYRKKRALATWIQEQIKPYIIEHDPILTKDYRSVLFNAAQNIAKDLIEKNTVFQSMEYTFKTLENIFQQAINDSNKKEELNQHFKSYLPNISNLKFTLTPQIIETQLRTKYPNTTEDLDGDEIKHLLNLALSPEQLKQNFTIIDDIEVAEFQENFGSAAEKWHNHDNGMHIFLLGTMSQKYSDSSGHWYMVVTQKINGQKTIFTADSLTIDRTRDQQVQRLIEKLENYK